MKPFFFGSYCEIFSHLLISQLSKPIENFFVALSPSDEHLLFDLQRQTFFKFGAKISSKLANSRTNSDNPPKLLKLEKFLSFLVMVKIGIVLLIEFPYKVVPSHKCSGTELQVVPPYNDTLI